MKNQTAVEWLVEQIRNDKFIKASDQIKLINQAKEMEKQQIIDAFNVGEDLGDRRNYLGDKYYNETFKQ